MKNFTLALNIVLVVAVAALFYLHFSTCKKGAAACASNTTGKPGNGFKIAYFEIDSIQNNFDYSKQVAKELGNSQQEKTNYLAEKKKNLMERIKEYQSKEKSMTQNEIAQAQQELSQREKDYQQDEQIKAQEWQDENLRKTQEVNKKIEDYLKEYNKDKNYAFIIANSSNLMYYKDTAYNITNELIKGLNGLYKKKN